MAIDIILQSVIIYTVKKKSTLKSKELINNKDQIDLIVNRSESYIMNIIKKAELLAANIENKKFEDGVERVIISNKASKAINQELSNLIIKVRDNTNLSTDSIYQFVWDSLCLISEQDEDATTEQLEDMLCEIEGDIYNHNLTNWLNKSNQHLEYVNQALEEFGMKDAASAIQTGQMLAKQEVARIVLNEIK